MIIWHRQLPSFYRDLCSDINLTDRYIYFALHYQPEQTSLPMAGIFENQYMTISLLSRFLPSDWYIYVKENPYQFLNMDPHQRDFKSKLFYKTVSELPGVKLIPMRYNSFELIDHSQAVATLTGMTGWEAINRGKPVLCFGYSSYRNNDGVFHINSDIDLLNAINRLENGSLVPDIKKIRFYVSLLYKHTSPGVVKNFEYDVYGINKETNSQSWYSEILKSL